MKILFFMCFFLFGCKEIIQKESPLPALKPEVLKEITEPKSTPSTPLRPKKVEEKIKYPSHFYQRVSVSISENVPLKSVLLELSKQAKVDLQLDPHINEHILFTATDRPFINVIESICDLAHLRLQFKNGALKLERDLPFSQNYNVQFLNISRDSQNKISVATDVFSQTNSANPLTNENGSQTEVNVETKSDFWHELENNLKILLQSSSTDSTAPSYSFHKQGGLLTVFATDKQHQLIKEYLQKLKWSASHQVLIEAKIIEVTLRNEFKSGINWQKLTDKKDLHFNAKFGDLSRESRFLDPISSQQNLISLGAKGATFSAILQALQEFGHSRTLSSPRLTVMNNQTAVLKVAQNQVYFRLNYDKQYNTGSQRESVSLSSDIQTVPIGLMMSVQPSIDAQTGDIILFLRPTISRLNQSVRDPAVDIAYNASLNSQSNNPVTVTPSLVPVVEVREIDSVLRLKNGEIAVLGGLMEVRSFEDINKIPGLGDIPLIKEIFSSNTDGDYVVELVILLKATIFDSGPSPDAADQHVVSNYFSDSRPFY